jgi:hypothetical protein
VTTTALPGAEVAEPYSATLSASGGSGVYAWTLAAGQLPAGLGLASTGLIGGTPLAAGTSAFTVRVVDAEDPTRMADAALEIVVASAPPPPAPPLAIATTALPDGRRDQPYSATLAASGGVTPYTWSIASGTLPNGLSLNAATGTIAGTPHQHGMFRFTVRLSDTTGATAQAALQLRIAKR